MPADRATPDRAAVVTLLVSIGRESLERGFEDDDTEIDSYPPTSYAQAIGFPRERGTTVVAIARSSDPDVRLAAISVLSSSLMTPT
ncbi:hypothetical protein [Streptomyces chartreusis]